MVVKQQKPLTVELDGGKLTLNANQQKAENTGNIYIAGVKDTVLDVTGKIKTTENVKLMSDNGVKMTEGASPRTTSSSRAARATWAVMRTRS